MRFACDRILQLLPVEAVLRHHLIDKLRRRRVVGEVAAHLHHVMLRFQQKAAGSTRHLRFRGGLGFAAAGSEEHTKGSKAR